jgi:hypothetical protein
MPKLAPDLTGAFIQRVESREGSLTLAVDGVRRCGLVLGGVMVFEGVTQVEGSDPRLPSGTAVLSGGLFITEQRAELNMTSADGGNLGTGRGVLAAVCHHPFSRLARICA